MDKAAALKIAREYAALVSNKYPVNRVMLYGSFARGNYHENSDIDIAVVVDKIEDDFLQEFTELFKLRRGISNRIEPVLIAVTKDRSGFLQSIMEYGEILV
jgi:predicted nucleotidyltransferase